MSFHELVGAPKKPPISSGAPEISDAVYLPPIGINRVTINNPDENITRVSLNLGINLNKSLYDSNLVKDFLNFRVVFLTDPQEFESFISNDISENNSGEAFTRSINNFSPSNNEGSYHALEEFDITLATGFLGVVVYFYTEAGGNKSSNINFSPAEEGQRAAMVLLENNVSSNKLYYFSFSDDSLWLGPVHRMQNGGLMTGFEHNNLSRSVTQRIMNVFRTQDQRSTVGSDLDISFAEPADNFYPDLTLGLNVSQGKLLPDKKNSLFSDFFMSKDEMGNCRFFFSIDWRRTILENSPYKKILKNSTTEVQELLELCKIQSLTLFRTRIKKSNTNRNKKVFSPASKDKKFISDSVDELVVQSRDNRGQLLSSQTETDPSNNFSELILPLGSGRSLRHFEGVDREISIKETGSYSYKIRLDVLDYSEQIIKPKFNLLRGIVSSLEEYKNTAIYFGTSSGETNYDDSIKFFSLEFINSMDLNSIDNIINDFVSVVSFFSTDTTPATLINISNSLKSYLYPNIATPQSIEFAINLVQNIMSRVESNIETITRKLGSSPKQSSEAQSRLNPPARNKNFVIEKEFLNIFTADDARTGFDFFNTTGPNTDSVGLKSIDKGALVSNSRRELELFYSGAPSAPGLDPNGQPNQKDFPNSIRLINPSNVYFSPQKIYSNGTVIGIENSDPNEYLSVISRRFTQKTSGMSNADHLISFFNDKFSVSVQTPDNENVDPNLSSTANTKEKTSDEKNKNKITSKVFETLYEIKKFITNDSEKQTFSILRAAQQGLDRRLSDYNIGDKSSLIRQNLNQTSQDKNKIITDAPFQIKRLIFNSYLSEDNIKQEQQDILLNMNESKNYSYFVYRMQTINKLMMLEGYELNDNGEYIMKKPKWVSLLDNPQILNQNLFVICKSMPFESKELGIKRQQMFDLPTYDEYFIMRNEVIN